VAARRRGPGVRGRGGRTAAARGAGHRHQQDRHAAVALAGPDRQVRRRAGRLRRDRPDRALPHVHVAAAAGRRQAHVQLHIRPGRAHLGVHVRPAVGDDRLARGDVDVHVLRAGLLVHARRARLVARRLRQPEEPTRHVHRPRRGHMEQSERVQGVCRHVRQL